MNSSVILLAFGGFIAVFILMPLLIKISHRFNFLDYPTGHKSHQKPTPFSGGWLIFVVFWITFYLSIKFSPQSANELGKYLPGIFLAHLLIFCGGLIDDFIKLKAYQKLLIQITACLILINYGLKIDTIYVPFIGSYLLGNISYPVTIIWVLLIVNALNIIDGLDGLAAGLAIITSIGLLYTAIVLNIHAAVIITILIIAILLAFLRYNFNNAKIFLGDSGSQSIGFIFAVIALLFPIKSYTVVAMFIPLLSLGVPLLETAISFTRRLLSGKSVVIADKNHLFHFLLNHGKSKKYTVLFFYYIAAVLQIFIFTLFLFDRRVVFSILVLFMAGITGWFFTLRKSKG